MEATVSTDTRVRLKPSALVQKLFMLHGEPFSIADYPYLKAIYDTPANEVGLFTARQIAKSTTLASKTVMEAVVDPPGGHQVIVMPLQDQAYVFSTQRLRDFIQDSPIIKDGFFTGPNVVDQMLRKVFSHGTMISLGYAQRTADRLRGRSAGRIKFDEVQDIFPEVIPIVKEMAFRAKNPSYWYCGTPKTLNNHMEAMRNRSTANEWAVKCQTGGCGKWNLNWHEKNVGDTGVVCEFCQKPINTNLGQWVQSRRMDLERGKDAKITMESFRIPQLIVKPIMDHPFKWRELLDKVRDYPTEQLYNEVFGLPFDSGQQPITLTQLIKCCIPGRRNRMPNPGDISIPPLCMGVDWAFVGENSYTFVVVGAWNPFPHVFDVYYWKIFTGQETDSLFQIEWITQLVRRHNVKLVGADWGAGHVQNLQLINKLGEPTVAQLWHTSLGQGVGGGSKSQPRAKFEPKTRKWHLNRTAVLTDTFETMRKTQVRFPCYEDNEILFKHIMAESLEFNDKSNRQFYTHVDPDDGLHALCYAMLAGELLLRGTFGGHAGSDSIIPGRANAPDRDPAEDDGGPPNAYY